ncbi:hypothetical protein J6590_046140 [Homalodisca vitripennis]|nr:hypothetical protein J6590_046140 [Homalodisca vitripennis]
MGSKYVNGGLERLFIVGVEAVAIGSFFCSISAPSVSDPVLLYIDLVGSRGDDKGSQQYSGNDSSRRQEHFEDYLKPDSDVADSAVNPIYGNGSDSQGVEVTRPVSSGAGERTGRPRYEVKARMHNGAKHPN